MNEPRVRCMVSSCVETLGANRVPKPPVCSDLRANRRTQAGGENIRDRKALAETGGFEPPIRCDPYNGLANRRLQPLGHVSGDGTSVSATSSTVKRPDGRPGGVRPAT
jgi:hypothetical protein